MDIFDVLSLICGVALFLYGMEIMGDSLKRSAGSSMKTILGKLTSSPVKAFLLGLGVTAVIQSSSATTVMVIGFVNSGTMTLLQAVGVIIGANVGTAVTAWLTGLSGLGGAETAATLVQWLKPDSWMPILALIGICLVMFTKRGRKKDIGATLLGFAVLMVGMSMMSEAVGGLKDSESFRSILTMFKNPILGVLAGLVLTAIVQSSSASVGILQSMTATGAITYGTAIPIIMGQNIGACVTVLISSVGANKNGRRAAMVYLYFNVIGAAVYLGLFYLLDAFLNFSFVDQTIGMWGVAVVHTVFKLLSAALLVPFNKQLAKLATLTIRDKKGEKETVNLLDERLLDTPAIAVGRACEVVGIMAETSTDAMLQAMALADGYDAKQADRVRDLEAEADQMEDALGSYLVKLSACSMDERNSKQVTKLLRVIGDYERISDHAVNVVESIEELKAKKQSFSPVAREELNILSAAITEILTLTRETYLDEDIHKAADIESLEQVVDDLMVQIKMNHTMRLQRGECSIELGFVLNDLLIDFERVSDHCSNIGSCIVEVSRYGALDMHRYLSDLRRSSRDYEEKYQEYKRKYSLQ